MDHITHRHRVNPEPVVDEQTPGLVERHSGARQHAVGPLDPHARTQRRRPVHQPGTHRLRVDQQRGQPFEDASEDAIAVERGAFVDHTRRAGDRRVGDVEAHADHHQRRRRVDDFSEIARQLREGSAGPNHAEVVGPLDPRSHTGGFEGRLCGHGDGGTDPTGRPVSDRKTKAHE